MKGIVLFAHGSRDPDWAKPFEAIRDSIRRQRPESPIAVAYLEQMTPTLEEAVATVVEEGASSVTVFPLFMAQGGHLKHDLPLLVDAIRASHPHVPVSLESALGDVPEVVDALAGWILRRAE
jgi:sirohydrochlorin cobaltochelatase